MKRILIVDDEPFFLKVLSDNLGENFTVITSPSAEKAILTIEDSTRNPSADSGKFDLIITDLNLPGMNGFQFAQYIRAKNRIDRFTPVIMLTQHNITKEEARKHGCAAYLPKSDINKVVSIVRILLATR